MPICLDGGVCIRILGVVLSLVRCSEHSNEASTYEDKSGKT